MRVSFRQAWKIFRLNFPRADRTTKANLDPPTKCKRGRCCSGFDGRLHSKYGCRSISLIQVDDGAVLSSLIKLDISSWIHSASIKNVNDFEKYYQKTMHKFKFTIRNPKWKPSLVNKNIQFSFSNVRFCDSIGFHSKFYDQQRLHFKIPNSIIKCR